MLRLLTILLCATGLDRASGKTRIGICINGASRTFTTPMVYASIRRNLIDAFAGADSKVVIFGVMKVSEDPRSDKVLVKQWDGGSMRTRHQAIVRTLQALGSNDFTVTADYNSLELSRAARKSKCYNAVKANPLHRPLLSQLITTSACKPLIETYEATFGHPFDILVHARPDATWYSSIPSHEN